MQAMYSILSLGGESFKLLLNRKQLCEEKFNEP